LSGAPDDPVRLAWVPCPDAATAESIGRAAVEARLAACANILPGMVSIYRWDGGIQTEPEVLLTMKTVASRIAALTELVTESHPYELPAIVFLPVGEGLPAFLEWVAREASNAP